VPSLKSRDTTWVAPKFSTPAHCAYANYPRPRHFYLIFELLRPRKSAIDIHKCTAHSNLIDGLLVIRFSSSPNFSHPRPAFRWAVGWGGPETHRSKILPSLTALKQATINGAKQIGIQGLLGEFIPAAYPDLLFSNENPLEDVWTGRLDPSVIAKHPPSGD
jgi:hypothetical protein